MKRHVAFSLLALTLVVAACGDDEGSETSDTTSARHRRDTEASVDAPPVPTTHSPDDGDSGDAGALDVVAGQPFPAARCEANRAAGSISYLTGFDFAATASIVDVIVANDQNYYTELCLDVDIAPSFSTANYPLVAANEAQFSSSGSFSELATFAATNEADLVALAVEGHVAIDSLMVKPEIETLEALAGTTIGVKGKLPPSIAAMLAEIGLVEGTDFETLLLEGFDPLAHWEVEGISAGTRLEEQRARHLGACRCAVQSVRPGRFRHPWVVRADLLEPYVPRTTPDSSRGLHACDDARPRRRDR